MSIYTAPESAIHIKVVLKAKLGFYTYKIEENCLKKNLFTLSKIENDFSFRLLSSTVSYNEILYSPSLSRLLNFTHYKIMTSGLINANTTIRTMLLEHILTIQCIHQ